MLYCLESALKTRYKMAKLTLEGIGKLAGVSRATVSRVINNYPHIRTEVRERVLKVIEETGYQPNLAARSLASSESNIIGLVIPSIINDVFTDPYYPRLTQGIAQACNENGLTLSLFLFHSPEEEKMAARRIIGNSLLDGIILTADILDDPMIPDLIAADVPFVQVGRPQQPDKVSFVDTNNAYGGELATNHLIQLGYSRIGQIATEHNTAGIDRTFGYRAALKQSGIPEIEDLIVYGDFSRESGYHGMQAILPHAPDAVFIQSDTMALGAMQAIRETGLSVPDDIAIVSFDNLPPALLGEPPLTTVHQPIQETGTEAVKMLLDLLRNGTKPPRKKILPVELTIRGSCGANIGD